jgi:hypothetical protein
MTQPLLYDDTPEWRSVAACSRWDGSDAIFSASTYWLALQTLNEDLMEVCEERGVPCLDLASLVPHSPRYFYDSMHFTEDGADLVGTLVAEFLLDEVL